ncbi:pyridine nucleotide transhydrogenase, putative [Babesia ovata]|uniref:Pyridine nucleotide transhydrogenase, putative n=1 Tax=Babesia ovata TaxID=189622 RepID=A0A2H6K7T0_9APIC|nr:pyridine nucleotide transhydrogenase, putative [Babesia ovata]GBE59045.1 pyridine nucleotide transhydrogenase, putative [Babesia ovata]
MVVEGVSAAEYLGQVRAAATRRTSEKLYKRLVRHGRGYEVFPGEDIPGSRILLGELLLIGFVEQYNSGGSTEDLMELFHSRCLHEISKTGYLLSYAQPYNRPPIIAFQNLQILGNRHIPGDLSPCSPQGTASLNSGSSSGIPSPTGSLSVGEVDIDASLSMTIGEFRHDEANMGQSPITIAEDDMSDPDMVSTMGSNVQRQISSITFGADSEEMFYGPAQYAESPQRLLETIGHTSAPARVWERKVDAGLMQRNCSVLWRSRIASLFTVVTSLSSATQVSGCPQCAQLLKVVSSSFPWRLSFLLWCMRRIDNLEAVYGQMFHELVWLYHNGDALMGTYYGQVANSIGYNVDTPELVKTEAKTLAHTLVGWLSDQRIHRFIEAFPNIKLHKLLLSAILKLAPASGARHVDPVHLKLFRGAAVSFMLGFGMHVLEDICNTGRLSFDKYTTQGVQFSYRLNLRLRQLGCMVEEYVNVAAPYAQARDGWKVIAPFLGSTGLCRWLQSMNFLTWSGEGERMQCRLAIVVLHMVALNHQHPFLRSGDIMFLRKFHCLPWASALTFCCKDPAINHMVAPLTSALVQCLGEGMLLNLASGDTVISTVNDAMLNASAGEKELHGYCAMKLESIVSSNRTTMYTLLRVLWPKIMSKTLGYIVRRMALPAIIYYSASHLMRLIWNQRDPQEGVSVGIVPTDKTQERSPKPNGEAGKQALGVRWAICHLNTLYSIEPTLFDSAFLDSIIYNYVANRSTVSIQRMQKVLMLFHIDASAADIQNEISSNYIALHQNPINVLLRMPGKAVLNSFVLRAFPNLLLQLFHSLYKYVCYGFSSFNVGGNSQLEPAHINSLQEAAALNVILDLLPETMPRAVEINISSFLSMLSSKATFTDETISASGLPPNKILSWINLGVPEERSLEKVAERFKVAVHNLLKSTKVHPAGSVGRVTIIPPKDGQRTCLEPYSAGDVATYHLYTVLLQVMDMPELSKTPGNIAEDTNAQRFVRVIDIYWRCLQKASMRNSVLEFIKSSISIVLRLHYLCPWMVNKSTEKLQTWIHSDRGGEPELQEFTRTVINSLRQIYDDIAELQKLDEFN